MAKMTEEEKKIKAAIKLLEKHGYEVTPPAETVVIDTTELNKRKLEVRRGVFISQLTNYIGTYTNDLLNAFYSYWSEPNKSFTKMRFEMQKTWDLSRRLQTWFKNEQQRNRQYGRKPVTTDEERARKLADILTK